MQISPFGVHHHNIIWISSAHMFLEHENVLSSSIWKFTWSLILKLFSYYMAWAYANLHWKTCRENLLSCANFAYHCASQSCHSGTFAKNTILQNKSNLFSRQGLWITTSAPLLNKSAEGTNPSCFLREEIGSKNVEIVSWLNHTRS